MKEKQRKKNIIRNLEIIFIVLALMILSYIFIHPKYVMHEIVNATYMELWGGEIMVGTDDKEVITQVVQYMDTKSWKRIFFESEKKYTQGLPTMYILFDNKYNLDFWVTKDTCEVHVYYHASGVEIGIYEMDIKNYYACVEYLDSVY